MDNINLFSRMPADVNKYICSFLPEKDYGIYTLVSKNFSENFCNHLWPQYLTRRNIKVIDGGKFQVFKNVRSFCTLFTQPALEKILIEPKPKTIFEAKEFLKNLPLQNKDLVSDFETALWDIVLYSEKNVSEEAIQILMEFDVNSFKSLYGLYMTSVIYADLSYETLQNFMEKAIPVISSKDLITYLKIAIEQKKTMAINFLIKNIVDLKNDILTLALNQQIDSSNIKRILDKTKSCNYVNLLTAMAGGYKEEIVLEIIKKLRFSKDLEITPDLLEEAARREFSRDMIENIRNIHNHIISLSKFKFISLLDAHEQEFKKNKNSWLSEDCSKGILVKLLSREIELKTFYHYHEYKTLSTCYAKSSEKIKESLLKKLPIAAYNFNLDQFLFSESILLKSNFVINDRPLAGQYAIAGCKIALTITIRVILFFDKERKKIEMQFNREKITIFSSNNKFQKTFERHEKLQKEHNLHSFIATWIDPNNFKQRASEAASFMNHKNNIPFKIYKSSNKENEYTFYCDQDFEENPKRMAKFKASDLTLNSDYRASQRAYLAGYYEEKAQVFEDFSANTAVDNLDHLYTSIRFFQKAKFWYEKAAEDKHIDSCLTLMNWYDEGNLITKPSIKKSIMYLNIAAHAISDMDERADEILSVYLQILEINLSAENREAEIAYCKKRLAALSQNS